MTVHPCGAHPMARDRDAPTHPVDVLSAEHRVIVSVLKAMTREERRLAAGEVRRDFWRRALLFLEHFADRCHHGKEEGLLFEELVRAGLPPHAGPVAVMKHEHVEGRALRGRMEHAFVRGNAADLAEATRVYVALLREHIEKEDGVLFVMARTLIDATRARALLDRFAAFERDEMGAEAHCHWVETARELSA